MLVVLLAAAQAPAANVPPLEPSRPSEPLMAYAGDEVAIRYVPGALDRAVHVAKRLDLVVGELQKRLGMPLPLTGIVLTRDEWERQGLARTYGLPFPRSMQSIAVPAAGDLGTVRKWKTWLGSELPPVGGVPLVGTADDAASLMLSDVILQVEACELLLSRTSVGRADPWIRGLLSHLVALSLWSEFEPSRTTEIAMVFERIRGQVPPLLALETKAKLGDQKLAMERWLLAEAHLFAGASVAYAEGGSKSLKKVLKGLRTGGAPPARDQLLALYPGLAAWLDGLPPEAGILAPKDASSS
jgi:hypothetical protein